MPLPDRPSGLEPGGGGRQSKPESRRTTGRQAKGRPGDWAGHAPDPAGGQGVPFPDRPSWLESGGGGRQSKSRRTTGRQAKGRPGNWADSAPDPAGGRGASECLSRTSRLGSNQGAAAGSQSPGRPPADKPRVGRVARYFFF